MDFYENPKNLARKGEKIIHFLAKIVQLRSKISYFLLADINPQGTLTANALQDLKAFNAKRSRSKRPAKAPTLRLPLELEHHPVIAVHVSSQTFFDFSRQGFHFPNFTFSL